jgi:hypothetical protein
MNKAEVIEEAKRLESEGLPIHILRRIYKQVVQKSGFPPMYFLGQVYSTVNTLDGRCPDGCCGGEHGVPAWKPTPCQYVVLAKEVSRRLKSK